MVTAGIAAEKALFADISFLCCGIIFNRNDIRMQSSFCLPQAHGNFEDAALVMTGTVHDRNDSGIINGDCNGSVFLILCAVIAFKAQADSLFHVLS